MARTEFHPQDFRDDEPVRTFEPVKVGETKTFAKVVVKVDGEYAKTARIINATMILEMDLDELSEYIDGLSEARDFLEENDQQ